MVLPSSDAPLTEEAADSGSEASPPVPPRLSPSARRGPGFPRQWSSGEGREDTHTRELREQDIEVAGGGRQVTESPGKGVSQEEVQQDAQLNTVH